MEDLVTGGLKATLKLARSGSAPGTVQVVSAMAILIIW
ncbi:hypothetical protein JOF35_006040 [Streptomyces demainii]|uniref:Uncharacterized protein n=1 Tax=Streptomyces demainii TaxID=588122 RepID=A0ABT9L1T0_9ACTN|nr:hypothetical protein [Streptomyces demainii]